MLCWSELATPNNRPSLCFIALISRMSAACISVWRDSSGSLAMFTASRRAFYQPGKNGKDITVCAT
jgi:hypothetical protein